ncbi:hydrolase [Acetobacteraceae bacterium KSS8]|uniref:Hydrolase n=1 Tax=Endosaccharibacter trunci TaxID=2812733 RepID=A0ABT1W647_9PROT|nr:hydrolase [Acetobacteraceae bacterium KSS8]
MIELNAATTALILIDLQKGIVSRPLAPRSGADVVRTATALAGRFRAAGATIVAVNVDFAADGKDLLRAPVDRSTIPPGAQFPADWSELVEGVAQPGDLRITKRQWGAFHDTGLDLQLRRRGITTVVIGGIATNMGVESTARAAHEHNYAVVLVEDCCAGLSDEMHGFAFASIFPMISRVSDSAGIAFGGPKG